MFARVGDELLRVQNRLGLGRVAGRFARALGRGVRRPAFLPAPGRALRVLFGELANEGLLASTRAVPTRLVESGYGFAWPEIDGALGDLLR